MPEYSSVLKSINARDDSLFMGPTGKAMFNHSKNHKRCILLAEGFYEWRRRGKERVPFYTRRRDGNLMLMAAIYDVANIKEEAEPMYTYATITTNASPQLDWLHDRMPVLIPNNDHDKIRTWLDPNLKWNATLQAMLKPCDEFMKPSPKDGDGEQVYALETFQVDEKVNSVKNDSPDFAKPWNSSSNKKTLNRFFFAKAEPTSSDVSSASTTVKKEAKKEDIRDFDETLDYTDDMAVMSDSAENAFKDEDDLSQDQVSVAADDSQRDAGFEEQERKREQEQEQQLRDMSFVSDAGHGDEDSENRDLELALKLSRQDQADKNKLASSPSSRTTLSPELASSPSPSTSTRTIAPVHTTQIISPSLKGSVDLLEKRREQRKQEEEEMKRVLEMSRLEAIADGHEDLGKDNDSQDSTMRLSSPFTLEAPPSNENDLERREAEELEKAIAASLNETGAAASPTLSPSTPASSSSPTHAKKLVHPVSPTASPRKRKPATQPSPSSPAGSSPMKPVKKGKPSQDVKITSFFQHTNPP
ncbi:hypothetical protein BGW39_008049 [Mortierella sp. 14UC]|nr:hypothetical protein BGW39_008049 [Mortierella sp. 14UC]